jgi:demethylmenaquinone methyltransferase/2-methoxy-6-polyprenyl-1,4-benzoquinol methylase/phosphoethanolamine N-methyltransferase
VRWARLYDVATTLLSFGRLAALHRAIVAMAGVRPGERVLDVGCGPGRLAIVAAAATGPGGEVCGIDPAREMVELARRNAARAGVRPRFEVAGIEALPFEDRRFDVVVSNLVFHHLPDDLKRRGLREVHRVLRPGGRVLAVDFGATPGHGPGHILCVLRLRTGWDHAERLRRMLGEAGFVDLDMGPTGHRGLACVRGRTPPAARA